MNNIEQKHVRAEIKQATDAGEFEAIIATLNVIDSDGDIIVPGAFGDSTMSIVPAHDHSSVPLGKAKMVDRGDFAIAAGQFNLDVTAAKEWHSALKFDLANPPSVQEWSFAFRVLDSEEETRDGKPVRILKRLDIMEVSPVLRGAGVGTGTVSVKQTFEAQLDTVIGEVTDAVTRAKQIAEMRAQKSKPKAIGAERKTQLATLREQCQKLDALLDDEPEEPDSPTPEELILAEQVAREAGF